MSISNCNITRKSCNKTDPQAQLRELLNRIQTLEDYTGTISNYVNKGGLTSDVTVLTNPILVKLSDTGKGLKTLISVKAGEILAEVAAEYETQTAAAALLLSAQAYADGVSASLAASVAATYETQSAAAQLLLDAKSYADGVVSSLSASVSATYETQSAAAQLLFDAKSYADGAVSTLAAAVEAEYETQSAAATARAALLQSAGSYADGAVSSLSAEVSSTYETLTGAETARAALLLNAKSYADGVVSSASASLSASIGGVAAGLELRVTYDEAAETYTSKASLTAGEINFKADKNIYFNFNKSYLCKLLFGSSEQYAYGGITADPINGNMEIGFYGDMETVSPELVLSPDSNSIFAFCDVFKPTGKLVLSSDCYGDTLPTTDKIPGRIFFLKA